MLETLRILLYAYILNMIRLTLNPLTNPEIHLFSKSQITIGSSQQTDLFLEEESIQPIQLKIIEQDGDFFAVNLINDPFVEINGFPFGRKMLKQGDMLSVHDVKILFEKLDDQSKSDSPVISTTVEPLNKNSTQTETPKVAKSLKDDYLREFDDDNPSKAPIPNVEATHLFQAWKWILLFIFSVLSIATLIGIVIFFSVSDKTEAQETKAAEGVADIAMALTYAQVYHLKPNNQNWSDVDFLKSNLQAILQKKSSYAYEIDSQGQFHCCPYTLRIYTSNDLSHFLLIAQPAPSLLQWLIPKSAIVLDSEMMELRSIQDLRYLNRLLTNSDPLDGANGKEIRSLVMQGSVLSLYSLAQESKHLDFTPPESLEIVKPGAENFIYNAPRYYRLGHSLLQKAIALTSSKSSSQEVVAFKQEFDNFSAFAHWVLYAEGEKAALLSKQGMKIFAPSDKLLFGYLTLDEGGKIHRANLLPEEETKKIKPIISSSNESNQEEIALKTEEETTIILENDSEKIDKNHPLYIQLASLAEARKNELKPIEEALNRLLKEDFAHPNSHFQSDFQSLSYQYITLNIKQKQMIKEALKHFSSQYQDFPIAEFMKFLRETGLDKMVEEADQEVEMIKEEKAQQNLDTILSYIENVESVSELEHLVQMATLWLNFDYIQDPQDLIHYQNQLRNLLLAQLEKFILSGEKPILQEDNAIIDRLLNHEELIQPEERHYFLEEFNTLFQQNS